MSEPIRAFFIWKPDEYINKSRSAIEVMFPVSMGTDQKDRHKQSGKYLDTLITLLEEYAPKNQKFGIKKITIVTGGDIYKLYWSEEAAKNTEAVWLEKESKKFDKLQALGMEVEFIFWNEILKTKAYRLLRRSVDKLYATHKQFVDLINEAISVHASKVLIHESLEEKQNAAREFLLQESAVLKTMKFWIYPGSQKINNAIAYAFKYTIDIGAINNIESIDVENVNLRDFPIGNSASVHLGYSFNYAKEQATQKTKRTKNSGAEFLPSGTNGGVIHKILNCTAVTAHLFEKAGIKGAAKQAKVIQKFLKVWEEERKNASKEVDAEKTEEVESEGSMV